QVLPRFTAVGRLVNTVAGHIDVTDRPGLAGSGPDRVWLRRSDRQRADGRCFLIIEDRLPFRAAIGGLEHPTRGGTGGVRVVIAGRGGEGGDPVTDYRAQKPEAELRRLMLRGLTLGVSHSDRQ